MRLRATRATSLAHAGRAAVEAGPPAAPTNSTAPVITGTAQIGSTLTASRGSWAGSSPIAFTYQWLADDVEIGGATAKTYLVPADEGVLGTVYTVEVTATNAVGSGGPLASSNSKTAVGVPPSFAGTPAITGTMLPGETVTASYTPAGTGAITPTFTWYADAEMISGETASTLDLTDAQIGQAITVAITLTSTWGTDDATTAARTVAAPAPVNTDLPVISGTPNPDQTLTVSNGTWDYSPSSYTYQWYADAAPISGQTANTYDVPNSSGEVGKLIHAVVTATNDTGNTGAAADAVEVVAAPSRTYATWAPADKGYAVTLSNGNLTTTYPDYAGSNVRSTIGKSTGKHYWEIHIDAVNNGPLGSSLNIGVWPVSRDIGTYIYNTSGVRRLYQSMNVGDVIGLAFDADAGTCSMYQNGVSLGQVDGSPLTISEPWHAVVGDDNYGDAVLTANFGTTPFAYSPPEGYTAGLYEIS